MGCWGYSSSSFLIVNTRSKACLGTMNGCHLPWRIVRHFPVVVRCLLFLSIALFLGGGEGGEWSHTDFYVPFLGYRILILVSSASLWLFLCVLLPVERGRFGAKRAKHGYGFLYEVLLMGGIGSILSSYESNLLTLHLDNTIEKAGCIVRYNI